MMMNKRSKRKKHWLLALSAAVALTAAVPGIVHADKAVPSSTPANGGVMEAKTGSELN
ncbi:hypothetical protein K0T92_10155 [Paenibacillus oenotherae]|uniref:Uncharacterized protein n=1 Tax=Paenibacillus oenotherae TaxID=1435645 RepID=A0ABS7D5E4_9BACL|nr:hypothetical protein [Paenibacillus oenotherae]MBW7475110.1 hypothetical protein [Paenibacillus oenotherae]